MNTENQLNEENLFAYKLATGPQSEWDMYWNDIQKTKPSVNKSEWDKAFNKQEIAEDVLSNFFSEKND